MKTWRERIVEARERGFFTLEEINLARNWCSCAVGEQAQKMPTVVLFKRRSAWDHDETCMLNCCIIPKDRWLTEWGSGDGFYAAVSQNDFLRAESYLDKIEDRALLLKRKQG